MVYSRTTSTRAYIQAVALCALAFATLPSTKADVCGVSDSDKRFGIRVVNDVGCASGGLGCYNDHCRYCKILENPKSTQFESCSTFGAFFLGMPAPTLTTGPCEVSEGDAAAGIAAVTDTDCLYGGLGCFGDHCRFCKVKETPESTAFMSCSGLDVSTLITKPSTSTSTATATTPAPTKAGTAQCTLQVSQGDASAGINIVSDGSCSSGGVGCIDNVCRFCRVATTVASAAFPDCNQLAGAVAVADTATDVPAETDAPTDAPAASSTGDGGSCDLVAAEGDIKAGISIVSDPSCAAGGIGCLSSECRYCRLVYTIYSGAFTDCSSIGSTSDTATSTDSPTEAPPADTPTDAPPADTPSCAQVVSSGDAAVGINIVTDSSCSAGGTGCIDNVCRFCKVTETTQSAAFVDCTSIGGYTSSIPTTADAPTTVTTAAPIVTEAPTEAPSSGESCTQIVSSGDAAVGINIATDTSCANGGAGCIDNVCRFCKTSDTPQSSAFVDCTSIGGSADSPTVTPATEAPIPTETPAATPDNSGEECTQTVSDGDAAVGINIITDNSCANGGAGCIDNVCRFCKTSDTPQSAAFIDCP